MSSYFPIPPNIWIEELSRNVSGSITFLNIPNNILKTNLMSKEYKDIVYLGVYKITKDKWKLLKVDECQPAEFKQINREKLDVNNFEMLVVVPKRTNEFPEETINLPKPSSLRIDRSPIADRASINFSLEKSFTSYQGEYPFEMTLIEKGSFLSFDVLKNPNKEKFLNYLILINIFQSAKNQSSLKVNYFNPKNPDYKKYFQTKRNSFTIKNLNSLENQINNCETLFFTSSQCLFIPLTLSINIETHHLSLEHTHPPTELFFGDNKFEPIKIIKKQWI